jgi:hypothetical protein
MFCCCSLSPLPPLLLLLLQAPVLFKGIAATVPSSSDLVSSSSWVYDSSGSMG